MQNGGFSNSRGKCLKQSPSPYIQAPTTYVYFFYQRKYKANNTGLIQWYCPDQSLLTLKSALSQSTVLSSKKICLQSRLKLAALQLPPHSRSLTLTGPLPNTGFPINNLSWIRAGGGLQWRSRAFGHAKPDLCLDKIHWSYQRDEIGLREI